MDKCFLYNNCNHKNCNKICPRKLKSSYLLGNAGLPEKKWARFPLVLDSDGTDHDCFAKLKEISDKIVTFVKEGGNLFIHSPISGNGKTSWSIRLLQTYVDKTWNTYDFQDCAVLFISVPKFLESLKLNINGSDEYAPFILDRVTKADLVVWDDIAAKSGSDYEINKLFSLIDGRIEKDKANIYTSNLNTDELRQALGARLASRIGNGSINLEFMGADKRCFAIKKI